MQENDTDKLAGSGGLLKSSILVSAMTMISRVFGLARDMVVAYFFGAAAGADAFFLAFRIPNFFRRLFGEGAFSQAFVPVLSEYRTRRTEAEVRELVAKTSGTLGLVLSVVTLLGVLGAGIVITLFAPGFVYHGDTAKFDLAVDMLRLTFPYLMLISMTAMAAAVLNTHGRFGVPAFTPVLLNVSLIACAVLLSPHLDEPVTALAWGVLIAGVAQLTFQLPFLAREGVLVLPVVDFKDTGVRKIGTLMLPAIFGASVSQVNLLIDTLLASFLPTGSLSWLYYSDRLLELPLALFGIAIATVILPGLSKEHASESVEKFSATLNWAMKLVVVLGVPATAALVLLSDALIATLFFQGQMTERDVMMSGAALAAYGAGLLGHMLVKVLAPGYFARQDTKTPVRYGITAMVSNMVLNFALIWHFQHVGLALATTLSAFLNAGLLFFGLRKLGIIRPDPSWRLFLARVMVAVLVMCAGIYWLLPGAEYWLNEPFHVRLGMMLAVCMLGAAVYGLVLVASGFKYRELLR